MKPKYRYDIEQNSEEWHLERVGRIGASSAPDLLMAKTTKGYQALKDRLVEEKITGQPTESKTWSGNRFTERGHEFEPIARKDYEFRNLTNVDIIGIVELDDWVMCSPDGLIGDDKLHQIKCPIFNTQKKYLKIIKANEGLSDNELLKKIDVGYYKQGQYELYVSDRKQNVFTFYHPNLKAIDLTINRDDVVIENIKNAFVEIRKDVLEEVEYLKF